MSDPLSPIGGGTPLALAYNSLQSPQQHPQQLQPPLMQQPDILQAALQQPGARGARTSPHQSIVNALHNGVRGKSRHVLLSVQYRARTSYNWEDICILGEKLEKQEIKLCELHRDGDDQFPHKVPPTTMSRWIRRDEDAVAIGGSVTVGDVHPGMPHWRAERERGRTSLSKPGGVKGGGSRLGAQAEERLMGILGRAALSGAPYLVDEVMEMIRQTAVDANLKVHRTGKPYTMQTGVRELLEGFLARCRAQGIFLLANTGKPLSIARAKAGTKEVLEAYTVLMKSNLKAYQSKRGKVSIERVGNYDEAGFDLCDFASKAGWFLVLDSFGQNVKVSFEKSPHLTIVFGFQGGHRFPALLIRSTSTQGSPETAPHPNHAALLTSNDTVFLAQTDTGWITNELKTQWFKFSRTQRGSRWSDGKPFVNNCDGHVSNVTNPELHQEMIESGGLFAITPAHTTATCAGGAQQCDRGLRDGGPFALIKSSFRRKLLKHMRSVLDAGKPTTLAFSEIARILELVLIEQWPNDGTMNDKARKLNESVGYFENSEGFLDFDILAVTEPASLTSSGSSTWVADTAGVGTKLPDYRQRMAEQQEAVKTKLQHNNTVVAAVDAATAAIGVSPLAGVTKVKVPRKRHSPTTNGAIIGSDDFAREEECVALKKKIKTDAVAAKQSGFWAKHRAAINAAEQLFAASAGVIDNFLVKHLKALIVSRTGHVPTAKSNTGDAMLIEARAACVANAASRCPPVAPHDETSVNVDADGVNGDGANSVNGDGAHGYGDANDDGDGEGEDEDG